MNLLEFSMQEAADQHNVDDAKDDSISDDELKDIVPEGWTNAPSLMDLKADLEEAKPAHDIQTAKIKEWLDNLNISGSAALNVLRGNLPCSQNLSVSRQNGGTLPSPNLFLQLPISSRFVPLLGRTKKRQDKIVLYSTVSSTPRWTRWR